MTTIRTTLKGLPARFLRLFSNTSLSARGTRALTVLVLAALSLAVPPARGQFGSGTGAGTALSFDGVNDLVSISNSAPLNLFPLTIMGWFRNDDFNDERGLVNKYAAGSLNGYQLYIHQGTLHAWYFRTNGSHVWDGSRGLNGGFLPFGWVHLAFTVDATGGKVYVNGTLRDSRAWTGTAGACTTTNEMRLGWYGNAFFNNFWRGSMDEVSIWNVALSSNVIAGAINRKLAPSENNLVAYWSFEEGVGNTTADLVTNRAGNNRGTFVGGPAWGPSGALIGPEVTTRTVVRQTITGATLGGDVIPRNRPTTAWFEWGTNTSFGNVTPPASVGSGSNSVPVFADITGLEPGRTYHYRVVATNIDGRANALPQSFTQVAFPSPPGTPPLRSTRYDGLFSTVTYESRPQWDQAVPMTIEAWVYRSEGNRSETLVSHGPDSYRLSFAPRLRFYRGTNFAEIPNVVGMRKWTHIAVSYDGAIARFYINGEFVAGRALGNNGTGKVRTLLLGYGGFSNFFPSDVLTGNLDEVRLWSVARSAAEIRDGMYRELRDEPGLAAVFPWGGRVEEISGQVPFSANISEHVFGMAPRDLVVPRAVLPPAVDGNVFPEVEYLGAEQLVLRSPDNPDASDGVAYFVHTADDLFVGTQGVPALAGGPSTTSNWFGLFVDPNYGRPALAGLTQAVVQAFQSSFPERGALLNGDGLGGYARCATTNPLTGIHPCTPTDLWQVGVFQCGSDTAPLCSEIRVSRSILGSFEEVDGVALGHFRDSQFAGGAFAPENGFANSPATWLTMSYGEGSANLPRVRWSGTVFAGLSGNARLSNHVVTLFTSGVGYSQVTDTAGQYSFDVPLPTGQFITGRPALESFARSGLPVIHTNTLPNDIEPIARSTNGVTFPALAPDASGTIQLTRVDFFVQKPPPPAAITSATPASPQCGMVVRLGEPGGPGETVTLSGTNLHADMEFYLAPFSPTFPNSPAAWTLLPVHRVIRLASDGRSVQVEAPFVPESVREHTNGFFILSFQSQWRWVARDPYLRPGRIEFSHIGTFSLQRPPYPVIHGFSFTNRAATGRLNEFLACYGDNAYVGIGPARGPYPLYWALWFPVYAYWIAESKGSCVGMASSAVQISSGRLRAAEFDARAFTGNGIEEPGFPGEYDTSNVGGRFTRPPIPKDIWAHIRQNHGVQTTLEYLLMAQNQADGVFSLSGSPVARLNEIRTRPSAYTVCLMRNDGGGHCVTPYRVEDNPNGSNDVSRLWIYDNETPCARSSPASSPCVTTRFIDVHLDTDTFSFDGDSGDGMFAIPVEVYNGSRTAPIALVGAVLLSDPVAVLQLLMFVAGGADAHYTSPRGEWGWRADGSFVDNLPGLRAVVPLGSSASTTRSIPVFLAVTNPVPTVTLNVRDTNAHLFHVGQNGTSLQLELTSGSPGARHQISLGAQSNQLERFRFSPQHSLSNFTPRVGLAFASNACATFQWMGLRGEAGRAQEFRALKSRRAVEYCNETTRPTQHFLRVDAVDGTSTNNAVSVFGPFNVPTGAVHCVVLHDWPRCRQVRSELDLDANGTPDQVNIVTGIEIDSDGDGMPDVWETLHQLNPEAANGEDGADADPDHDSVSNLGEYLTDTDPRDATSALRLTATMLPANKVRLSWKAVPGRRYEILYANSLEFVFQPLAGVGLPRIATATEEHFDDTLPAGTMRARFYQLRLVP